METIEYGTYGDTMRGLTSMQVLIHNGNAYMVKYVFDSWSDPLGTLEVLDVARLQDEFGTGFIERMAISDAWEYLQAENAFRKTFVAVIRNAMGIF